MHFSIGIEEGKANFTKLMWLGENLYKNGFITTYPHQLGHRKTVKWLGPYFTVPRSIQQGTCIVRSEDILGIKNCNLHITFFRIIELF